MDVFTWVPILTWYMTSVMSRSSSVRSGVGENWATTLAIFEVNDSSESEDEEGAIEDDDKA